MSDKKKLSRAEQIERFVKANAVTQDKGILGHAQDAGLSLLSGAVSVPETAVGLADILSGGKAGKFLENQDGAVGFRPKETKEAISSWKTERGQKQLQDFQEAEGIGAKFGQAVRNPTLVTNTVLESLPAMGAGGVVGRGLGVAAKGISPVVAGAVGEGVVGAGMAAEAIRQQTDDGLLTPKQAGLAAATGVTTAGFGYGGGKVAQKLGLGDVDTMIVGGTRNASGRAGAEGAQEATNKGLVRRTLEAAATEGFLEELPQSVSEQVLQNIALENDIMDGVDEAAVLGVLSGGLMGGIAGAGTRRQAPIDDTPPPPTTDVSVRDEPPQGPTGPTEPAGIDNLNRNFYDQGRGPDNQGMRDVTPTAEPKDVPTDPLSAAANTAQNTDIPQLGFYGDRARDTEATDNAPVEPTPAEKMGLDETQGGLTAAAAKAVNSGASAAATQSTDENTTASNENTRSAADKRAGELRANAPYKMNQAEAIANNEAYGKDYLARQQAEAAATTGEQGAVKLTDENPTVNIPAPRDVTQNSNATEQNNNNNNNELQNSFTRANEPAQQSSADNDRMAANTAIATGKDGTAKWFGREDKAQEFVSKKSIADTHEVVAAGKSRFEIQPKAQTTGPTAETSAVQNQTSAPKRSEARNTPVKDEAKSIGKAYTADNDEVPYQWDVVDAKDLVSSHTNTFGKNPDFPADAQPRDRANAGYQAQVLDIINKFNPEFLGESALASAGSPIIGSKDNVVESGNGRTIAIRTKYENGSAEPYRQFVQSQAEKFGLDPETIAGMSEPVLVRRNLSDMDRGEFAVRANKDDKAAMGSTEIARIDAKAIPNTDLIEFDKNGSMNLNASRKFTQAFTKAVGTNEAGNLIDKDGNISQTGKLRITGALLHNAYDSDKLTRAVTETLDPSAQNVLKVLTDKAPQINKIKQHVESGKRTSSPLAEDIKTAAEKYIDLVESGANIDLFLANNDLFSEDAISEQAAEIIGDFYANPRSATKIGQDLQARIDADTRANDPNEAGLFGVEEAPPVPNNKKRSILRSKNQSEPVKETPKTIDYLKGKLSLIGNNTDGNPVYENKDGVRTVVADGKAKTEAYRNEPTETGFKVSTPNRTDEFKLADETVVETKEPKADTASAKSADKITGQEGWQGNLMKSRNLARQLNEAGYITDSEMDPVYGSDPKAIKPIIDIGLDRQDRSAKMTAEAAAKKAGKQAIEDAEVIEDTPAEAKTAEPTSAKAKKEKERFSNNSFTNKEEAERRIARIKSKMGTLNSGIDPEMLADGAYVAVAFIEDGILAFKDFAKAMTDTLGNDITPYLSSFWEGARRYPGFTGAAGMTSVAESDAQFAQLMLEYKPSKDMESVLGEDKTQVKPKRKVTKPTNKDVMLRQDWGVNHIDGYVESDEFKGEQTDYGVSGGVKDAFLKDAKNYLTATKKHLESLGYTMALDRKGKPLKVNVNAAGPAVSGDVSLSMYKDGSNIHVSIGQSSVPMMSMFRDINADGTPVDNAPHPQQVAVMYRTSMNDGDTYATKHNNSSGNIWLSHKLTATELAADIDKTSNAVAARANKSKDSLIGKDANYGVSNIDDRSDADEIIAAMMEKEDDDTAASNDRDQESGTGELSAASSRDGAQRRAGSVRTDSVADVGAVDRSGPARDTSDNNKGQSVREAERSNDDGVGSQQGGDGSSNAASTRSTKPRSNLTNHRLQADDLQRKGSWFNAAENNVAVIELIQKITNEDRAATAQEKQQLALYTGWGASEIANGIFPNPTTGEYKTPRWQELGEKLKDLLTPTDYATARQTTQYAHYTPPVVVEGIYKALDRFGFAGGQVLEPASGVGVFNGLMPDNMAKNSTYTGIELDPTTGTIAQLLYPQSRMLIDDYTETKLPDNHFDVAVGNPPFANISYDYGKGKDKQSFQLHDYFFVKTMDKVKPGGIVVFVTSTGTMDKKTDGARKWLSERADLIGAVRLPQTAFKENSGTETVTDIIFLRKRKEGEQPSDVKWSGVKTVDINGEQLSINEYYANNPDMVVGKAGHKTNQFGKVVYNVTEADGDFGENLQAALDKMPANIFSVERGSKQEAAKVAEMDFGARSAENKEGGVYIKDGTLMRVQNGIGIPLTTRLTQKGTETPLTDKQKAFLTDYVPLREALKQAQRDQLDDNPNWEASLANLNKVYDAFVKKHGPILKHSISEREVTEVEYDDDGEVVDTVTTVRVQKTFANSTALFLDAESSLVRGLENIVEGKTSKDGKQGVIEKGDFFKGRTLNKPKRPTINSTQDALEASLNETGSLDVARVAELVGKTQKEVIEDLGDQAYFDPKTQTHMLAEDYLSGNVVEKLELARESLRSDPNLQRNISALEAVQPEPILAKDISANLGSVWVPTETIQQFATEVLGVKRAEVKHLKLNNTWTVDGYGGNLEYSSGARKTTELLASLLGSKQIVIKTKMSDGTSVLNEVATQEANDAADKIKDAWKNWVWEDNTRAATLSEIYNKLFNNIVPAFYGNGEHLTLDGMSSLIKLRPHQKRGIYRVIRQGDIYLNHAVGAGKTFTMIASAMEEKRLGLINKPMFVVPNHMLDQFSQEFLMLYPAANIMVADTANFHTSNRRNFIAQAAVNSPDAIIITHSSFGKIGVSNKLRAEYLQQEVDNYAAAIQEAIENGQAKDRSVKQMESAMQTIQNRIGKLLDPKNKDNNANFEDMGVDRLYVDEMHEFRKLSFPTKQGRVKGITSLGSQKAMDLKMKVGILRDKGATRAIVGASGTPITNTMGELFTVQRFFDPNQLEKDGLSFFDSWAAQFGETVEGLEQSASGGYAMVKRFAKFQNMPELMSRVRSFMDVLTNYDLGSLVQRPEVHGGSREIVVTPTPDGFVEYQQELADRIEAIKKRGGKPQKGDDIILSVITDGRFAALDMRFVDSSRPSDPNSKLNYAIEALATTYKETADLRYTTDGIEDELPGSSIIMFSDIGLGEDSAEARGFDMKAWINSELIRMGVDRKHIAFISDYKSHAKKGVLFEDMRQGKKRILIGGKGMETGMNIQKRLSHLYHLDAPWFPASVEQREGRIIRQGNQNTEVSIKAFATKGSYDSTMWTLVGTKARFIEQAWHGDSSMRSMDDVSEASSFEQAAALSSGDQRYVTLALLRQKHEQLERASNAYHQRKNREQKELKQLNNRLVRAEQELLDTKAALKGYVKLEAETFNAKIGSSAFDSTVKFGEQLALEYIKLSNDEFVGDKTVATVGGYPVVYSGTDGKRGYISEMNVDVPSYDSTPLITDQTIDDVRTTGLASRIMNRVNNMVSYVPTLEKEISDIKVRLPLLEKAIDRPFDKQAEKNQVTIELAELTYELESEAESAPDNDDQKFSRTGPVKGSTKTTPKQVIDKLVSKFGQSVVDKLIANGTLEIKTLNDYVVDGELVIPSDVDGIYHQGKAILIADNLSDDMIIPTFLHELGGHGGLQTLMDKKAYAALMRDFDALVKAGDPMAMQAKAMADSVARNKQDALDEYLPYLITLASRAKAKQGKIAGMINRIAMAIRSWLRNTLGMSVKMNAQDVLALAERMVEARTQPPLNNIQSPINSFEGVNAPAEQISAVREEQADVIREAPNGKPSNLTEQQWLQVRTPAFKQWFGDWENDPANASKILDENGEPLVLYHGAKSDFWVFDMSRSVPQRNEGMMGMFFTDNAKTAAGYTVDLRKEAAVVKAKEDLVKINNEFGFKRRQLEVENKTGDEIQELTKKEFEAMKAAELKLKATIADAFNNAYDNAESRTKAVFVKSQMPFEQDADGKSFLAVNKKAAERYFVDGVYDGIVNNNVLDDANANHSVGAAKVVISFDATNIKSATDNMGAFSKTNDDIRYSQSNDGMKFSRAAGMNDQFDPRNIAKETAARFHDWVSSAPPGKLSWWHKTVGTMYNLAQRNKFFKPVFDHTEKFINDVSFYAAKASEFAPKLLPKLDGLKDITKTAIGAKDNDAISKPIFEGTLLWGRDLNGKAVLIDDWRKKVMATSKQDRLNMLRAANRITPAQEAELAQLNGMQENRFINGIIDDEVSAGLVWTDSELRSKFNLSDEQIKLYREFRAATDNSLDSLTRSDMLRKLGKDANDIEKLVMDASSLRRALFEVEQHINNLSTATPRKAQAYAKTLADIKTSVARTNKLIADGYAPLSRFGQYTVDVVDAAGNREYFGLFESAYDARKMAKEMSDLYGADFVTQGTLSSEEFKMFAGVTPETAELFGEMLGLEATGDNAADQAFQEFLRRTKNNRSAMKRLMHRKGIKGYSEDVGRVLASFIYSNARHTSAALNMGNLDRSIQDIPKGEGQLKDAAVKLAQYIKNPQEEGHVIRGFMFAQYLGGSIASAMVNLTQPIAVSFPYLSQFGGAKKAAAELSRAAADWAGKKAFSADLQKAIDEAEADGTLSPQEVHNLLRQAQGKNPLRAGDGTKYGDAKAAIQNTGSRIGLGWGAFFSLAEQINRRVTFVAAYRMAQDQGMANPAEFASRSIKETQFVYNKASRMQWGRGAIGGTLMTFKTYSVSYIELMHRLWTQGEKGSAERAAGRKAAMIMIATLFLLGGGGGLPFMEDIEDVIDGASQVLGYNLSTRKAREEFLDSVFGEMLGDFMESGISGIPGMPTDVSGRLGMGNLVPGTGVFKQRTSNTKDVLELAGPAGDFVSRVGTGTRSILKGAVAGDARQVGRGVLEISPVAVRNAAMGAGMLASGTYKDTKGYKVDDVTPIDAAFKALGFQPKEISKIQGQAWLSQTTTAYYNLRASEIRALWAAGISEGNKSKIADAQKALADWNNKNPSQIIVIRPTDIQRRVREMNMSKSDRVTKLAPKTMRAQIQDDFANARGDY